jgi:solute carrier family 25 (mitochondrial thiamine pyrophosphate transporter), member 19
MYACKQAAAKQSKSLEHFLAGAGAGCAATVATYPFDIARTAFAGQGVPRRHLTLQSFTAAIVKSGGVGGLYAGLAPALVQVRLQLQQIA